MNLPVYVSIFTVILTSSGLRMLVHLCCNGFQGNAADQRALSRSDKNTVTVGKPKLNLIEGNEFSQLKPTVQCYQRGDRGAQI